MKCPVCKTECLDGQECPECGFSHVNKSFTGKEEATLWEQQIVLPYKQTLFCISKRFGLAKKRMNTLQTDESVEIFYKVFADMVKNDSWVAAPVNDRQHVCVFIRDGYYMAIYSDMNNRVIGESKDVVAMNINTFIDILYGNPHILGFVVDPNVNPFLIHRNKINNLTVKKNPRLQMKDWGVGIPDYTPKDLMSKEELLDFAMEVVCKDYILKNDFIIEKIYYGIQGFPNFALRKDEILYLMKVDVGVVQKPSLDSKAKEFYVSTCKKFNAKCLYATLTIASTDTERAANGIALYGDCYCAAPVEVEELL